MAEAENKGYEGEMKRSKGRNGGRMKSWEVRYIASDTPKEPLTQYYSDLMTKYHLPPQPPP